MPSRDINRPGREWYGTARWQKFRRAYLTHHPLCAMCQETGKLTPATVVDHKRPHRGDEQLFWTGPFQALCKHCHDAHKQAQEKSSKQRGCDASGIPLAGW